MSGKDALDTLAESPAEQSKRIVSSHQMVFSAPPNNTPSNTAVDGPLLGNGDLTVAMGGVPKQQHLLLCKNDLWRLQHGNGNASPLPFGHLTISIADLEGASYTITQDLYSATTTGSFQRKEAAVGMTCYVAATANLLVVELVATGRPAKVSVALQVAEGRGAEATAGRVGDIFRASRAFTEGVDIPSGAAVAFKTLGAEPSEDGSFLLTPGKPVTLVLAIQSMFQSDRYVDEAVSAVSEVAVAADLANLRQAHEAWWAAYWERSYVDIGDPVIEKQYYLSLYGLGSCSRDPDFPPAIFGWTTSDNPAWNGDYHLNYNHQAPFYGLARANRLEQADPHDAPLLDFLERGRRHCRTIFGFDGAVYPVGIGPRGIETTYGLDLPDDGPVKLVEQGCFLLGQRTNAAYGIVNMATRWYATCDRTYGARILPFVRQVATFWENYLTWDEPGQRYVVQNDACHENSGPDTNSCLSLALVRTTLELAIDLCRTLDRDCDRCEQWDHILHRLSGYSTQQREGKMVFRYCERGTAWRDSNTIGIQHIYPAGQVHLDSDPDLLEIARNTIEVMARWHDNNGANSFFPAAVRAGYDPETVLRELRKYAEDTWPNGFRAGNAHGIENFSTVPNTINEMLCMDHGGVLRLFRVWPKDRDASFRNIRCRGAFLASGELKNRVVRHVTILSEKGRPCTVENPWPGHDVSIFRNGSEAGRRSGARFTFETEPGESIHLIPAGNA